jgi:hypothetical protein
MTTALWRRLDVPGHDLAQLVPLPTGGFRLAGVALFAFASEPCRLDYVVLADAAGAPISAAVSGSLAGVAVRRTIAVDGARRWSLDGAEQPDVQGALDLALGFTPAALAFPPLRLALAVGASVELAVARVRFPELTLAPARQRWTRLDERRYALEDSSDGPAELTVPAAPFVRDVSGRWAAEALTP